MIYVILLVLFILDIALGISFVIFRQAILGIFLIITLISTLGIGNVIITEPLTIEQQHQKLKKNITDANKELAKFYIDHPELKEENNETGTYK